MNKHDEHCKSIAQDLEKYASGDYFLYDGDLYPIDEDADFWKAGGDNCYLFDADENAYYYVIDGDKVNETDIEPASLWDYFTDIFNIDYVVDSNKEFKAVRVMIACGGPNIYINTWDKQVELFWWSESGKYYLSSDICDAINDYFEELWNC